MEATALTTEPQPLPSTLFQMEINASFFPQLKATQRQVFFSVDPVSSFPAEKILPKSCKVVQNCSTKFSAEDAVNEGVDGGVDVAEPQDDVVDQWRRVELQKADGTDTSKLLLLYFTECANFNV